MLTSDSLADLEGAVPRLLQHLQEKGWAVYSTNVQGTCLSVKFWGVFWSSKARVILEAVIEKVQAFPTPTTVAVLQEFFGYFGLLESVYTTLGTNSEALILVEMKGNQVRLG